LRRAALAAAAALFLRRFSSAAAFRLRALKSVRWLQVWRSPRF
jgi:hypothetical protein